VLGGVRCCWCGTVASVLLLNKSPHLAPGLPLSSPLTSKP
jgi:hypothetical protein